MAPTPPSDPITHAAIDRDLYCVRCEYNLRTMALDAVCPECGLPVRETLRDETESPRFLRLRAYLGWYAFALILVIILAVHVLIQHVSIRLTGSWGVYDLIHTVVTLLRWGLGAIILGVVLQVTRRRMLARGGRAHATLRGILRLGYLLQVVWELGGNRWLWGFLGEELTLFFLVQGCVVVLRGVLLWALTYYLALLIAPCPAFVAARLRWWIGFVFVQAGIVFAVMVGMIFDRDFLDFSIAVPFPSLGDMYIMGLSLTWMTEAILGIRALRAMRRHIRQSSMARGPHPSDMHAAQGYAEAP